MPLIVENIQLTLFDGFRAILPEAEGCSFCVGYPKPARLGSAGGLRWAPPGSDESRACRLLVGMHRAPEEEMKALSGVRRGVDVLDGPALARLKRRITDRLLRGVLLDFQEAAVALVAHYLHRRGGVLLGDVVGLGKTLMATAIARVFQEDDEANTLVICPPKLQPMWEGYLQEYQITGRVLSLGKAIEELPNLPRYLLVVIDESHNLRNREGRRYRAIRDYIERNDPRVVLLTATPYNKQFTDISNQLRLFVDEDQDVHVRPERFFSTGHRTVRPRRISSLSFRPLRIRSAPSSRAPLPTIGATLCVCSWCVAPASSSSSTTPSSTRRGSATTSCSTGDRPTFRDASRRWWRSPFTRRTRPTSMRGSSEMTWWR